MNVRVFFLLLALAAFPVAAAAADPPVIVDAAQGDGVAEMDSGVAVLRPLTTLDLSVRGRVDIEILDDRFDGFSAPLPPAAGVIGPIHNRTESSRFSQGTAIVRSLALQDDAAVLITPARGTVRGSGSWALEASEGGILEESHAFDRNTTSPHYYSYEVGRTLRWSTNDGLFEADGEFDVYVWGIELEVEDAQGRDTLRTGQWREAIGPALERRHVAFGILHVDGTLTARAHGDLAMHAERFVLENAVELEGARGVAQGKTGQFVLAGDVEVGDGRHSARVLDGNLAFEPAHRAAISGPGASRIEAPGAAWAPVAAWILATLTASALLLRLAARWGWLGTSADWELRAQAAHEARLWRRARLFAFIAVRLDPKNGNARFVRAQLRIDTGPWEKARADYELAYRYLQDPRNRAVAAYEASRGHALLQDAAGAAEWLERAIELDAPLQDRAAVEADFLRIKEAPAFRARLGHLLDPSSGAA